MGDGRDGRAEWRHCWVCCEPVFQFTWLRLFSPRWYKLSPADLQNPYSFLMLAPKYYSDLFAYFSHILISKKQNASERIKLLSTFKVYTILVKQNSRIEEVESALIQTFCSLYKFHTFISPSLWDFVIHKKMFLFYEFIVVIKVNILKEVLKKKTRHILDGEDKRNLIQMSTKYKWYYSSANE